MGGGFGWLVRKHGLAADNLAAAEVATASGETLRADADHHGDLYWALRGGGGNFGVVTSFEYRLHPLGQIFGGAVFHPLDRAPEVLRFFREFTADVPDEVATMAAIVTSPDGHPVIALAACYAGDLAEGERSLAPLRAFGPPARRHVRPAALHGHADDVRPAGAVRDTTTTGSPISSMFSG